jgi:hypothetical protein
MCTVTLFYKGKNDFIITSNRDEAPDRASYPPDFYKENTTTLLYPKDKLAGGTWIGISDKNRMICLLNGGFEFHTRKSNYKHSRGIIVKDLLTADNLETKVKSYNFENIEPFTIVAADWTLNLKFFELVWDGNRSHFTNLPLETNIWSSSTLYTDKMKAERHSWFSEFNSDKELSSKSLFKFHSNVSDNMDYGIIMDRGFVKTTSITQIEKTDNVLKMTFLDLTSNSQTSKELKLVGTVHE